MPEGLTDKQIEEHRQDLLLRAAECIWTERKKVSEYVWLATVLQLQEELEDQKEISRRNLNELDRFKATSHGALAQEITDLRAEVKRLQEAKP